MKHPRWLALPFVLLAALTFASRWTGRSHLVGNLWAVCFVACILAVPVVSRQRLWLGYAGLFFPFVVCALIVFVDWGDISVGW